MQFSLSTDLIRLITEQAQSLGYSTAEDYLRVVFGDTALESDVRQLSDDEFSQVLDDLFVGKELVSLLPTNSSAGTTFTPITIDVVPG